jgi:hypothetical protein
MEFSNGGTLEMENIKTIFINTCSIDYFIFVIFVCTEFGEKIRKRSSEVNSTQDFYKLFLKIHDHLKNNNWNLARLELANFNQMQFTVENKSPKYDFYLNIQDSFLRNATFLQTYSFFCACTNDMCTKHGNSIKVTTDAFTFRY